MAEETKFVYIVWRSPKTREDDVQYAAEFAGVFSSRNKADAWIRWQEMLNSKLAADYTVNPVILDYRRAPKYAVPKRTSKKVHVGKTPKDRPPMGTPEEKA